MRIVGWLCLACLLALGGVPPARADSVGFSLVGAPDSPGPPLKLGIWYPTKAAPSEHDLGLFTQIVARDAPAAAGPHPLVVFSHGTGGSLEEHIDTALALAHAGFVVAAMEHTGDNYRDQSRATQIVDRPRAVRSVIDYVLGSWAGRGSVDAGRIGAFGFSSGGFTMLVAVGGVPDLARVAAYCAGHAATFTCQLVAAHPETRTAPPPPAEAWIADSRIRAAVIAAPALGFAFGRAGLAGVRVPIQLWRAGNDHILPSPDYAEAVREALPRPPEYHVVAGADHFDFLAPCGEELARVAAEICRERGGFDRAAFHRAFDRDVVAFFRRTLRR